MNRLSTWHYSALALALTMGCLDTAMGQSFALQTPNGTGVSQISLSVASGGLLGQVPYRVVSTTATNYPVSLSLSLDAQIPYFASTQTSGSTPLSFAVYQQFGAPDGTYTGNLTVSSTAAGTTALSIPLSITVGGTVGTGGALISNPASLTFTAQTGTTPPGQFLTVTLPDNAVTTFSVGASTQTGASWLQVFPITGIPTGPSNTNQVSVTVSTGGLSIGTYTGTVSLSPAGGGTPTLVPVTLNVTGSPTLTFSPAQLSFAYQVGTSASGLSQTLNFTTDGVNPLDFTLGAQYLTGTPGWLVLNPLGGTTSKTTPGSVTATVIPGILAPGTYTANILVNAIGASNPAQTIPVTFLVSTSPLLEIGTPPQPFNYQIGQAGPASQTIALDSSSTAFAYSTAISYDAASGSTPWLSATPPSGNTPATLTLTANPAHLPAGKYTATITVTAPGSGNSPQQFQAVLNVSATTLLTLQTSSLSFAYETGKVLPGSQQIQLGSTGVPLTFTAKVTAPSCGGAWLSVQPTTGTTPATLTVSVLPGGIALGNCGGSITLTAPGSSNTLTVPVSLNVSDKPLLNVVQNSLTFNVTPGSGASQPQFLSLTSTDASAQVTYTVTGITNPGSGNWLFVGNPGSGLTPASVPITVTPGTLAPGTYSGTLNITSPNLPSPQNLTVTMNILSNVSIVASPAAVSLVQAPGSSTAVTQTVQITTPNAATGLVYNALASTTSHNWLSVAPAGGLTPGSFVITANSNGQLSEGTYQGTVTIQAPGAANSPLSIPVSLTIGTLETLTLTPSSVSFTGSIGGLNPPAQTVQVGASSGVANLTVATSNTTCGGNWFSVAPLSGPTPATLTITPNLTGVPAGTCTGTITLSAAGFASQTLNISLTATNTPAPAIGKVQNSASFAFGGVSPGEILYLEGSNLGPDTLIPLTIDPATLLVSTSLDGTEVLFDGQAAPLVYVSATKISVIVPYEVAGRQQTNIQVRRNGLLSAAILQSVVATAPGIFTSNASGSGEAAALNQNGTFNGPTAPAPVGTVVSIYGTGEGLVSPLPPTGSFSPGTLPLPLINAPVTVKFGGVPLDPSDITYSGPAPTLVAGAIQINFRVPSFALPGPTPVQVIIGDGQSNIVTVVVGPAK